MFRDVVFLLVVVEVAVSVSSNVDAKCLLGDVRLAARAGKKVGVKADALGAQISSVNAVSDTLMIDDILFCSVKKLFGVEKRCVFLIFVIQSNFSRSTNQTAGFTEEPDADSDCVAGVAVVVCVNKPHKERMQQPLGWKRDDCGAFGSRMFRVCVIVVETWHSKRAHPTTLKNSAGVACM